MEGASHFSLKWNDFKNNVCDSISQLFEQDELFDVTIVSSDLRHVQAHKLMLSACSEFFRHVLKSISPTTINPLIYLRGTSYDELTNMLKFFYRGEVSISQCELDSFLMLCREMGIKGLNFPSYKRRGGSMSMRVDSDRDQPGPLTKRSRNDTRHKSISMPVSTSIEDNVNASDVSPTNNEIVIDENEFKIGNEKQMKADNLCWDQVSLGESENNDNVHIVNVNFENNEDKTIEKDIVQNEKRKRKSLPNDSNPNGKNITFGEQTNVFGQEDDVISEAISQMVIRTSSNEWRCGECGKLSGRRCDLRKHIECVHFSNSPVRCNQCSSVLKNRHSLQVHMSLKHSAGALQKV